MSHTLAQRCVMRWLPLLLSMLIFSAAAGAAVVVDPAKARDARTAKAKKIAKSRAARKIALRKAQAKAVPKAPPKAAPPMAAASPAPKPVPKAAPKAPAKAKKKRSPKKAEPSLVLRPDPSPTELRWAALQQAVKPADVARLCEEFEADFPSSEHVLAVRRMREAAQETLRAQRTARLSSDALEEEGGDGAYRAELVKALRGDGNSARRVAEMYGEGTNGLPRHPRRNEQWLHFAAELGNAAASWQLAQILNEAGEWSDAAKYERKSVELGYHPPPRLPAKARDF